MADGSAGSAAASGESQRGLGALVAAFTIWGILPLYLRPLHVISPAQIMSHRLVWCCVFVLGWLRLRGSLDAVKVALRQPGTRWRLIASAILISVNWLVFVWAVGTGRVVESSLGYFINPLVNVLLGVVVLRERLNKAQWSAVGIASAGVIYLTWLGGAPPWVALVLAFSFGSYGLIRKTVAVDALVGLGTETLLIAPLGLVYIVACEFTGQSALREGPVIGGMLALGGVITAVPLALFAYGARRVRYSTVGLVQYIGPTMQLLLGVYVFREPFTPVTAIGYSAIWAALAIYAADGVLRARSAANPANPAPAA